MAALQALGVPVLPDRHLVTHGNIGTAAGCLAAVDLVGWVLERVLGPAVRAAAVASVQPVGQGMACLC